jgi:hypothetical protein
MCMTMTRPRPSTRQPAGLTFRPQQSAGVRVLSCEAHSARSYSGEIIIDGTRYQFVLLRNTTAKACRQWRWQDQLLLACRATNGDAEALHNYDGDRWTCTLCARQRCRHGDALHALLEQIDGDALPAA